MLFSLPIQTHDREIFTAIYNEYFPRLFAFTKQFMEPEDAADVLSDVFMGLWKSGQEFEAENNLNAYLFRSAKNRCLNHARFTRKHNALPEIEEEAPAHAVEAIIVDKLLKAVEGLPTVQRRMVKLHYMQELTFFQIAEQTGMNYNTVKQSTYAALRHLRKYKWPIW